MANEQQQQPQKPTASQRIDSLENGLGALFQTADNLARDMMIVKDAIKLLGNKLDAVVKLSNREVSPKSRPPKWVKQFFSKKASRSLKSWNHTRFNNRKPLPLLRLLLHRMLLNPLLP